MQAILKSVRECFELVEIIEEDAITNKTPQYPTNQQNRQRLNERSNFARSMTKSIFGRHYCDDQQLAEVERATRAPHRTRKANIIKARKGK